MSEELIDVPDSPEVRIARLDESLKNLINRLEDISDAYAPTNKTVIENALKISEIQQDITEIRHEITKQVDRREQELDQLEKQVLACAGGVGDLESRWRREREAAEQLAMKERRDRNRWIIGVGVSVFLVILGAYLGSIFGG